MTSRTKTKIVPINDAGLGQRRITFPQDLAAVRACVPRRLYQGFIDANHGVERSGR